MFLSSFFAPDLPGRSLPAFLAFLGMPPCDWSLCLPVTATASAPSCPPLADEPPPEARAGSRQAIGKAEGGPGFGVCEVVLIAQGALQRPWFDKGGWHGRMVASAHSRQESSHNVVLCSDPSCEGAAADDAFVGQ
eukprot:16436861-Heterocapsa_arctica.AAC.1